MWAILPQMESVADFVELAPNGLDQGHSSPARASIDGPSRISTGSVSLARDIKPPNLLVDRDFCLNIMI